MQNGPPIPWKSKVDGPGVGIYCSFSSTPFWQLGAETGVQSADLQFMRTVFRVMPLMLLPVTIHFPSVGNGFVAVSRSFHLVPLNKLTGHSALSIFSSLMQAVYMYWLSSNMFSLCQVACLRIPAVRTALKIPQRVKHDTDTLPPQEGFLESFKKGKECWAVW